MQKNIVNFNVLSTLSAAGADITFANNKFSITGGLKFDPRQVQTTSGIVTTVAETPQVYILTPTASQNSTEFSLHLVQVLTTGVIIDEVYSYVSDASMTATEVADAFRGMINQSNFEVVASGTATLILTANAGNPLFTCTSIGSGVFTGGVVNTTPGIAAVNTYASLVANGVPAASLTVGATYTSWTVTYVNLDGTVDKLTDSSVNQWTVYAQDGITNLAAFVAKLSLVNSYVTANPLNLSLRDTGLSAAINSTATATAAQVSTGYITSTSGAATAITLPTGTLLGAQLGASAGTVFDLIIDNTAGSNTVTIAVGTDTILSTAAADSAGSFGDLTVASGVTGIARYTFMFSSATACCFTRTA